MHFLISPSQMGLHSQAGLLILLCVLTFVAVMLWETRNRIFRLLHRQHFITMGDLLPEEEVYHFGEDQSNVNDWTQTPC